MASKNLFHSLRDHFRRKARPEDAPEIQGIAKNKLIRKAVLQNHFGLAFAKGFLGTAAAVTAFAFATSFFIKSHPDTVSKPFDRFMKDQGYPDSLSQCFETQNIRVYDRSSVLFPVHYATSTALQGIHDARNDMASTFRDRAWKTLLAPDAYMRALYEAFGYKNMSDKFESHVNKFGGSNSAAEYFITPPPSSLTAEDAVRGMLTDRSGTLLSRPVEKLEFKSGEKEINRLFFAYVILHEARHPEQYGFFRKTNVNEIDADKYSFQVMEAYGANPAALKETMDLVATVRAVSGALCGDIEHASSNLSLDQDQTFLTAFHDESGFTQLHKMLVFIKASNHAVFPQDMDIMNCLYHVAVRMLGNDALYRDKNLRKAAGAFVAGCTHLDALSGGKMLDRSFDGSTIDLNCLNDTYQPAQDRLSRLPQRKANSF